MPSVKKDFEAARLGVFATLGLPLTHFNCGIRVNAELARADRLSVSYHSAPLSRRDTRKIRSPSPQNLKIMRRESYCRSIETEFEPIGRVRQKCVVSVALLQRFILSSRC
jgi:hypothetical protein